ncbi:MAG TPA: M20 family peptidase [Candidatus Handelsmanbacteria bacterium]|nr:M20 family peptidase [Candidatus Handelsmanbacteria bacterium]
MTWTRSDNEILATLQDLVAIDSVNPALPGGQQGEGGMVEYLSAFFTALDIPYQLSEVLPGRHNFIARFAGENPERQLLFECHMDTASAEVMTIPPFEPHIRDGLLYGRGSCDTKAGGAAMIHAIKRLREAGITPPRTILYAGTIDEEAFFAGTNHLAEHLDVEAAVICEPTDLDVVRAHKGAVRFHLNVTGKAAHSAKPHLGINAITKMARLIARIADEISPQYAELSYPLLGSPTFNVGTIAGGAQVNFVPDQCRIAIDCRLIPGQTPEGVVAGFKEVIARAKAEDDALDATIEDPFFICAALGTDENAHIVSSAAAACDKVLGKATIAGVPYATDGSPFSARGVPTIVLGPGSIDQAHGAVEWVECQQVVQAVDIYQQIMQRCD